MQINGEALRAIRRSQGLSIKKLAIDTGIDPSTISRLEKGERKGTVTQHQLLAVTLGVPLGAIVALADSEGLAS